MEIIRLSHEDVEVAGKTRDLSSRGAYFVVTGSIEAGSSIEFVVTLQEGLPAFKNVRLKCRGHVTRAVELGTQDRLGVAATIDRYEFLREELN